MARLRLRPAAAVGALLLVLLPAWASAQALPNLAVLRVRYNAARTAARPEGDLKAQLDALDKEITEALRLGRNGEVRRLLARGTTLLDGREWTDVEDFRHSLVLRAERVFADSARPFTVRLEQIYAPAIELTAPITATAALRPLLAQPTGTPETLALGEQGQQIDVVYAGTVDGATMKGTVNMAGGQLSGTFTGKKQ